ncbi:DUF2339 domain-containing protein [Candidatus Peregrinibacteria bacterium]|nr:DUF2339 domain-containing protein [Candidatus Peregrinibacteria bacterium]
METIFFIVLLLMGVYFEKRISKLEKSFQESLRESEKKNEDHKEVTHLPEVSFNKNGIEHDHLPEKTSSRFVEWLVTDWIMKLGALLILLGFAWLTSYAFLNNWIGPMGRITFGILSGAIILLLGELRIRKFHSQGVILLSLGATTIHLSMFAARELYDFFTPSIALLVMALPVIFLATLSVKHKSLSLAILGLVLGAIAPLLTNASPEGILGIYTYLFLIIAGTFLVTLLTEWRILTFLSLIIMSVYSVPYFLEGLFFSGGSLSKGDVFSAQIFTLLFGGIFYVASLISIFRSKKTLSADIFSIGWNALYVLAWIQTAFSDEWKSLITSVVALIFMMGAYILLRSAQLKTSIYTYGTAAFMMIAAATAFELSGPALLIAYTLEAGIIPIIVFLIMKNNDDAQKSALLLALSLYFSGEHITSFQWRTGVFHGDSAVLLTIIIVFSGLFVFFSSQKYTFPKWFLNLLLGISGLYGLIFIWLSVHAGMENETIAQATVLTIYTLLGIGLYLAGRNMLSKFIRYGGGALVGFVVLHLLFVEIWEMSLAGRIITFFLIGILLMSTALLERKSSHPSSI